MHIICRGIETATGINIHHQLTSYRGLCSNKSYMLHTAHIRAYLGSVTAIHKRDFPVIRLGSLSYTYTFASMVICTYPCDILWWQYLQYIFFAFTRTYYLFVLSRVLHIDSAKIIIMYLFLFKNIQTPITDRGRRQVVLEILLCLLRRYYSGW